MRIPVNGERLMSTAREPRRSPAKKAVNVTVDAALLSAARVEDINLSATLERALTEELRLARRERWRAENARAIAAYNEQVDEHGVFSDALRSF
jgi:antitoxin CcdA